MRGLLALGSFSIFILLSSFSYGEIKHADRKLDGHNFSGTLRIDRGFWRWISSRDKIQFEDGMMIWGSGKSGGYYPSAYTETDSVKGVVIFEAFFTNENGDNMVWKGGYDGSKIFEVKAKWVRNERNLFYDILLPKTVHWSFEPH